MNTVIQFNQFVQPFYMLKSALLRIITMKKFENVFIVIYFSLGILKTPVNSTYTVDSNWSTIDETDTKASINAFEKITTQVGDKNMLKDVENNLTFSVRRKRSSSDVFQLLHSPEPTKKEENISTCPLLPYDGYLHWKRSTCYVGQQATVGMECVPYCKSIAQIVGPHRLVCGSNGEWLSSPKNIKQTPKCSLAYSIAEMFKSKLKNLFNNAHNRNLLFILHESDDISYKEREIEKSVIEYIVHTFPLSNIRNGGLILFSSSARIIQNLNEENHCYFLKEVLKMDYSGQGANFLSALALADREISEQDAQNKTIIIFLTDRDNDGPPTWITWAEKLKKAGNIIFTFGVHDVNKEDFQNMASVYIDNTTNFYYFSNFSRMKEFAEQLKKNFRRLSHFDCSFKHQ